MKWISRVFNYLTTDLVRCFKQLTYYMAFLVQIPLSVLATTYEIKSSRALLLCQITFSCSDLSQANHHGPFLPLPNDCWSTCSPHGNVLPQPWARQQPKGLEHGVKPQPAKMWRSSFGSQVTSSNSAPSSIVTTSMSHFQWIPPIIHRRKWKKNQSRQLLMKQTSQRWKWGII